VVAGLIAVLFRMLMFRGPVVLELVLAVFVLSAIGGAAFLLGRSHAKERREKKNSE
jgi:hypothetical protein